MAIDSKCRIIRKLGATSPEFEWRWLLHTRRVPALAAGQDAPSVPCAGIGDPDSTVLLCPWCARNLCHRKPRLPARVLANDMWGGRELPQYQKLRVLPATCCWDKVVRFTEKLS